MAMVRMLLMISLMVVHFWLIVKLTGNSKVNEVCWEDDYGKND